MTVEIELRKATKKYNYILQGINSNYRPATVNALCDKGHAGSFLLDEYLKEKPKCKVCYRLNLNSDQRLIRGRGIAYQNGGKLLTAKYLNDQQVMDWQDKSGQVFQMTYEDVVIHGGWNSSKTTKEEVLTNKPLKTKNVKIEKRKCEYTLEELMVQMQNLLDSVDLKLRLLVRVKMALSEIKLKQDFIRKMENQYLKMQKSIEDKDEEILNLNSKLKLANVPVAKIRSEMISNHKSLLQFEKEVNRKHIKEEAVLRNEMERKIADERVVLLEEYNESEKSTNISKVDIIRVKSMIDDSRLLMEERKNQTRRNLILENSEKRKLFADKIKSYLQDDREFKKIRIKKEKIIKVRVKKEKVIKEKKVRTPKAKLVFDWDVVGKATNDRPKKSKAKRVYKKRGGTPQESRNSKNLRQWMATLLPFLKEGVGSKELRKNFGIAPKSLINYTLAICENLKRIHINETERLGATTYFTTTDTYNGTKYWVIIGFDTKSRKIISAKPFYNYLPRKNNNKTLEIKEYIKGMAKLRRIKTKAILEAHLMILIAKINNYHIHFEDGVFDGQKSLKEIIGIKRKNIISDKAKELKIKFENRLEKVEKEEGKIEGFGCPNDTCKNFNNLSEYCYKKDGKYFRETDGKLIQRYICKSCDSRFSTTTNTDDRYRKIDYSLNDILDELKAGTGCNELARKFSLSPTTAAHQIKLVARATKNAHKKAIEGLPYDTYFQFAGTFLGKKMPIYIRFYWNSESKRIVGIRTRQEPFDDTATLHPVEANNLKDLVEKRLWDNKTVEGYNNYLLFGIAAVNKYTV